jgi:hypothetical protein
VNTRYFYQSNVTLPQHEAIIDGFANILSTIISLPPLIEICLYDLGKNVYGGIDMFRINRIGINVTVPLEQLPKILTHELIHVNQKHTGVLKIKNNGSAYWHGILITKKIPEDMSYEEYQNLPWELDVTNRQEEVFKKALSLIDIKTDQ